MLLKPAPRASKERAQPARGRSDRAADASHQPPMGRWADGPMGLWADGPMGRWADGPMGRWADGRVRELTSAQSLTFLPLLELLQNRASHVIH